MFLQALESVGVADILDIALVAVLVYAVLVWFKRAKAAVVAKGMLVVTAVYMLSRATGMVMTTSIFHGFFAILLVALVVIFQEELRSTFERIAVWSLSGGQFWAATPAQADIIVRTLADLSRSRVGALVVLRGKDPLDRHLEGGWPLGGEVSEAIIKSIFDDHSIGHDGAMIIEDNRVTRFGCRLPLSKEFSKTAKLGTRHTAALGLAELTDALCVVVSEESGMISVASDGKLEKLAKPGDLRGRILSYTEDRSPDPAAESPLSFLRKNTREKAIAFGASILLWVLFVLGAKPGHRKFSAAVQLKNAPEELELVEVKPENVWVRFSGKMRDFYWVDRDKITVRLDVSTAHQGLNRIRVSERNVGRPPEYFLEEHHPSIVEVRFRVKPDSKEAGSP